MKALALAATLSALLISGIVLWAFAIGSPMSGEPLARLDIPRADVAAGEPSVAPAPVQTPLTAPTVEANGLLEDSEWGALPRRAADGRTAAQVYATGERDKKDATPRIAIVVTGLGLDRPLTQQAVRKLPAAVTLALSPYGENLAEQAEDARRTGHELILQLPMEPGDYPESDAGPQTLLVSATTGVDNRSRLYWSLGRFTGYFAVASYRGSQFLASDAAVAPLFSELKRRGLVFFSDDTTDGGRLAGVAGQQGLGYVRADIEIDRELDGAAFDAALLRLEEAARRGGMAVGVMRLHAAFVDKIARWAPQLASRGIKLVPVSAAYVAN